MPFHGVAGLVHKAILWRHVGTDVNARATVSTVAEELNCRWDDTRRTVPGNDGVPIAIDATVTVEIEIPVGSRMSKGSISDLPGTGQTPNRDVFEVMTSEESSDWRGVDVYRQVTLARAGDTLPTQVVDPDG